MDKLNILEISYRNYGKCLRIANDVVEIIVTIEYGLRIAKYGYIGGKNHFKESEILSNLDEEINIGIGGHTLEYATNSKSLLVSNDGEVKYELIPHGVRFIQAVESDTKTQRVMEVYFEFESSKIVVLHRVYSLNLFDIDVSISGVTSMNREGIQIIPICKSGNMNLPRSCFVLWPYSNLKDSRVYFGERYVAMKTCEDNIKDFRIGFNDSLHYALYYSDREMFVKEFDIQSEKLGYPNNGCVYEAFISRDSIQMISNSVLYNLSCGNYIEHREVWTLFKDVNLDFIDRYIYEYK